MNTSYESIQDYVVSCFTIILAGLVLWGAKDIPPPFFDPLGSAAVPKVCAYILITLAVIISLRRFFENKSGSTASSEEVGYRAEPWLAVAVVGLSILYTFAMGAGWIGFRWGTVLYVLATGSILAKGNHKIMAISLALGLMFGIGGHYLFSTIFYIDLP
jgi:putative tricarboxylic transport membrane protein